MITLLIGAIFDTWTKPSSSLAIDSDATDKQNQSSRASRPPSSGVVMFGPFPVPRKFDRSRGELSLPLKPFMS